MVRATPTTGSEFARIAFSVLKGKHVCRGSQMGRRCQHATLFTPIRLAEPEESLVAVDRRADVEVRREFPSECIVECRQSRITTSRSCSQNVEEALLLIYIVGSKNPESWKAIDTNKAVSEMKEPQKSIILHRWTRTDSLACKKNDFHGSPVTAVKLSPI